MNKLTPRILLFTFSLLVLFYVALAFLAPVILRGGNYILGNGIYEMYERFCHQRVERSLFLFGKDSFYSIQELKDERFLPQTETSITDYEYFGHKYNGNEVVGYKVAICIRDIAVYTTLGLAGLFFSLSSLFNKKYHNILICILIAPIFIDIFIQMIFEFTRPSSISYMYIDNIPKRIVTGILAGIGIIMFLSNILQNSLTITKEKEKM